MSFCPLHTIPLQEVIGHQVAILVGGCAIHVPTPLSKAQHNDTGNNLPLVFRQEKRGAVAFTVQAHYIFIVILVVNEELVALAGRLVNVIEGVKIDLTLASPHGYALAPCQAHVIAPFFFHACQDILFLGANIKYPFTANVSSIGIGTEAAFLQRGQPLLIAVRYAGFDLEHERAPFSCLGLHKVEQHGHSWRVRIIYDGSARGIEIGAAQDWCRSNQNEHGRTQLTIFVYDTYAQSFCSQVWGQFSPFIGLGDITTDRCRYEIVPLPAIGNDSRFHIFPLKLHRSSLWRPVPVLPFCVLRGGGCGALQPVCARRYK